MATPRNTPDAPAEAGAVEAPLDFGGGELGRMLAQARRPQRWFISNPAADTPVPEGAFVQRGYPVDIAGLVVAIERVPTKFGAMPVYVLDVGKGEDFPLIRWGLTATLLRNAHDRHDVRVGDTIAAHCPGKRQGKEQEYEDWTMLVAKGDGTVPTAGVGPSSDEAPF